MHFVFYSGMHCLCSTYIWSTFTMNMTILLCHKSCGGGGGTPSVFIEGCTTLSYTKFWINCDPFTYTTKFWKFCIHNSWWLFAPFISINISYSFYDRIPDWSVYVYPWSYKKTPFLFLRMNKGTFPCLQPKKRIPFPYLGPKKVLPLSGGASLYSKYYYRYILSPSPKAECIWLGLFVLFFFICFFLGGGGVCKVGRGAWRYN